MLEAGLTGFLTAFSLILAIGAQNAMVLRQGLARSHVFEVCLFCALSDALLITAGVLGFTAITTLFPGLPATLAFIGAMFLIGYGVMRLWDAYMGEYSAEIAGTAKPLAQVITAIAAVTWLNPHVYLDTLALLGAISTQFPPGPQKALFCICACLASFTFFFGLGYGARWLAPIFTSEKAWRWLDIAIALVMFSIAFGLLTKDFAV